MWANVLKTILEPLKKDYLQLLETAAANSSSETIGNRFPWQTKLSTQILLKVAADNGLDVRILSGGPKDFFWDTDRVKGLEKCLEKGCQVRVLVWYRDEAAVGSRLPKIAKKQPKLQIRWSGKDLFGPLPHFLLVDENAYRVEAIHGDLTGEEFTEVSPEIPARICFNDPVGGKKQRQFFDNLWDQCRDVLL